MGNVPIPVVRVIVVERRRDPFCVAFHSRGSNKRGLIYRVRKSELQDTLVDLRDKHKTYKTLDIHCDKDIRELLFHLNTKMICRAGVRRVNLLSMGSCVLSKDSTICGVRIWEWDNDFDNRGRCMCRRGHKLNIENFVRPDRYLPSSETSRTQPAAPVPAPQPTQQPRPLENCQPPSECRIKQPALAPTASSNVPVPDPVLACGPNGRPVSAALPNMQEAAGELERGGRWGEVATTPQELNIVADGEQRGWSEEVQTGNHTVPPAVPDPPTSKNPNPDPPAEYPYRADLEIPPTLNMPGGFPDSDEWIDGGRTLAGGSAAHHVGTSVLSGSTIGDSDMHYPPRTGQPVDYLAHESHRRHHHRLHGHATDSASDTIYDSDSDVDMCRSENANHETVDVVAGAAVGGAVAAGGVVDDPATVKPSLGLFYRLFVFA